MLPTAPCLLPLGPWLAGVPEPLGEGVVEDLQLGDGFVLVGCHTKEPSLLQQILYKVEKKMPAQSPLKGLANYYEHLILMFK